MSGAAGKRHQSGRTTRQILMASLLDDLNAEDPLNQDEYQSAETEEKFKLLQSAIETINGRFAIVHNMVNDASDGLDARAIDSDKRLMSLSSENKQLQFELDMIKGLFVKSEAENEILRKKVTQLTAQSMQNNIVVNGLCNDESTENPVETITEFLEEKLNLEFPHQDIVMARRFGQTTNQNIPGPCWCKLNRPL